MGALLRKIQSQSAADSADLRKSSNNNISHCGKLAERLRKSNKTQIESANPYSVRTPKTSPHNDFRKSASPHRATEKNEKLKPSASTNRRTVYSISDGGNQSTLVRLAIQSGIYEQGLLLKEKEIATLVPPSDWNDANGCTSEELKAWAAALAVRAVRYRGQVPRGWDKVARCNHCGPVYLYTTGNCLACPWCEMKRAGKWFPAPNQEE